MEGNLDKHIKLIYKLLVKEEPVNTELKHILANLKQNTGNSILQFTKTQSTYAIYWL